VLLEAVWNAGRALKNGAGHYCVHDHPVTGSAMTSRRFLPFVDGEPDLSAIMDAVPGGCPEKIQSMCNAAPQAIVPTLAVTANPRGLVVRPGELQWATMRFGS